MMYQGKCSALHLAHHKQSGEKVAMKMYRKKKLSQLNRWAKPWTPARQPLPLRPPGCSCCRMTVRPLARAAVFKEL
jgi:hypothetical protein